MAKLPALPFARSAVTQGLGPYAAYRRYQDLAHSQGLRGVRQQDFVRLHQETQAMRADVAEAMGRPKNVVPTYDQIKERTTRGVPGHISWVGIWQRTRGQSDLIFTPYAVRTDKPITPAEAEQRAQWYLEQEEPDVYNRITLGVSYTGTNRLERR